MGQKYLHWWPSTCHKSWVAALVHLLVLCKDAQRTFWPQCACAIMEELLSWSKATWVSARKNKGERNGLWLPGKEKEWATCEGAVSSDLQVCTSLEEVQEMLDTIGRTPIN